MSSVPVFLWLGLLREKDEEERKKTLDSHIDEKFGEIFFMAKEEYDIEQE